MSAFTFFLILLLIVIVLMAMAVAFVLGLVTNNVIQEIDDAGSHMNDE